MRLGEGGGSDSLSERLDCLTRVSCKNTPERLYATAAGVWLNETGTVGFLSKLHIQIVQFIPQLTSQYFNIRGLLLKLSPRMIIKGIINNDNNYNTRFGPSRSL